MQRVLEYHRFAEECRKLCESLVNPRHKQKLQEMAAAWDKLAIERKLELDEKKPDRERRASAGRPRRPDQSSN
jgi:hypothetical protein